MTNTVDLDPDYKDIDGIPVPRITYQNSQFELSARSFYKPKMIDILTAAGAKYAFINPADDPSVSAHILGTLRFGTDSTKSVCDANGRFHDIGNLYASDGSLFPTSSGFNPTMTIIALAMWVGANIVSPGSPGSAIG
jgi:choline dehydrogenase-like flavoprotein